ncbi:hypothetical protein NLK61_24790 [Pseudomonas fuscovaginae UPB0736]|uniref:DUF6124 family protein n=1 Tax=Pseudomonas asplenii TaxID=53407 RepID=UPI00211E0A4E|nr:hypothetical protein [Pseudomonas fuscovaginae]UUQ64396.1 hypothetical protein NLK61_24790 [Pseudomonas fuscovaginae UPB0736]
MFKITPNPPPSSRAGGINPHVADRALSHYNLKPDAGSKSSSAEVATKRLPEPGNQEEALVDVYSILQSAAATAYEHADNQTGSNRKVAMGVVHLIELAQLRMDSMLERQALGTVG